MAAFFEPLHNPPPTKTRREEGGNPTPCLFCRLIRIWPGQPSNGMLTSAPTGRWEGVEVATRWWWKYLERKTIVVSGMMLLLLREALFSVHVRFTSCCGGRGHSAGIVVGKMLSRRRWSTKKYIHDGRWSPKSSGGCYYYNFRGKNCANWFLHA